MPSSLLVVALVVAWLVVGVPMLVRRRQEVVTTADSALAARVVRRGGEFTGRTGDADDVDLDGDGTPAVESELDGQDTDEEYAEYEEYSEYAEYREYREYEYEPTPEELTMRDTDVEDSAAESPRPYRRGRGGFDPDAAAVTAKAKYAFRQRVVLALLAAAVVSAVFAGFAVSMLWWVHGAADITLVGYLSYLRRQVRIEEEIRARRQARMGTVRRAPAHHRPPAMPEYAGDGYPEDRYQGAGYPVDEYADAEAEQRFEAPRPVRRPVAQPGTLPPGTVLVDVDDEDPTFADLEEPGQLGYRRAVGE